MSHKKIVRKGKREERGFTLVETLIAIVILTLSIVGPFQIVQGVLQSAYNARDQLIGAGLAQEGMEYMREIRDSNYLYNARYGVGSVSWMAGLDGTSGLSNCYSNAYTNPSNCSVDPQSSTGQRVTACGSVGCVPGPLYFDPVTFRYNQQSTGSPSPFTRTITLTQISASETLVTVTVTWQNHGSKSVVIQEYFRNWL